MPVLGFDITRRRPLDGGAPFGDCGPYEEVTGILRFAVDPAHPANQTVTDLDLAPVEADGRVHFDADFTLVCPLNPARGNGRLVLDVPNRGRDRALLRFNAAPEWPAGGDINTGSGFLMRRGFTTAKVGWQYDAPDEPGRIRLRGPIAMQDGQPATGLCLCEIQVDAPTQSAALSDLAHRPYPAADLNDPAATLTARPYTSAPRRVIARDQWQFARAVDGRPVADGGWVYLPAGFQPGLLYEVVYTATNLSIVGLGLLAVRDTAVWLKYGDAASGNPCAGHITHAYGFGVSQSGRFLRELLYWGLNEDEAGRMAFDGLLPVVTGARRGEFNLRAGQPSKTLGEGMGALYPFHDLGQMDPATMRRDGLLARVRAGGNAPKVLTLNTAAEYWGGDRGSGGQATLLHTDTAGAVDVDPPAESRLYLLAGAQHVPNFWPLRDRTQDNVHCAAPLNCIDYRPLERAALINLDRWVTQGVPPPDSQVPRLGAGTAVPPQTALATLGHIPGLRTPEHLSVLHHLDFGESPSRGVPAHLPPSLGEPYPYYVSAVDADGNEVAGIRHPDVAVPLATYTGWTTRHPDIGGAGELVPMAGATYPFARTAAERQATGDPRPSIAERYAGRGDYLMQVRAAAEDLVAQRFLLAEDLDTVLQAAALRWDALAGD